MSRSTRRVKTFDNPEVLEVFQEMLSGSGEPSTCKLSVIFPKYTSLTGNVRRYIRLMEAFANATIMDMFPDEKLEVQEHVKSLNQYFDEAFVAPDVTEYAEYAFLGCPEDVHVNFAEVYFGLKETTIVKTMISTCSNLVDFKQYLENEADPKDQFLTRTLAGSCCPLSGLTVDVKTIYNASEIGKKGKYFVLAILAKAYSITKDIYETISSPDFDVDEFVNVVHESIGGVSKHISGCDMAFNKIIGSIDLLKNNFGDYHRDYVSSNNPMIIMENFVSDVMKKTDSTSPVLMGQFRKIINHYREQAKMHAHDKRLTGLFAEVDKNMEKLASSTKGSAEGSACFPMESAEPATVSEEKHDEMAEPDTVSEEKHDETAEPAALSIGKHDEVVSKTVLMRRRKKMRNERNKVRRDIESKLQDDSDL